jgi:hypothetical protein
VQVGGAWIYVVLRGIHSLIHATYNRVLHRFAVQFCEHGAAVRAVGPVSLSLPAGLIP